MLLLLLFESRQMGRLYRTKLYFYKHFDLILDILLPASRTTVVEGDPKVPLFNSYDTEALGMVLLLSLDCSTYPWSMPYYNQNVYKSITSVIVNTQRHKHSDKLVFPVGGVGGVEYTDCTSAER